MPRPIPLPLSLEKLPSDVQKCFSVLEQVNFVLRSLPNLPNGQVKEQLIIRLNQVLNSEEFSLPDNYLTKLNDLLSSNALQKDEIASLKDKITDLTDTLPSSHRLAFRWSLMVIGFVIGVIITRLLGAT